MGDLVTCEVQHELAIVSLNRPPVNALSVDMLRALRSIFCELNSDQRVKVVIMTGGRQRVFCAGADYRERDTLARGDERARQAALVSTFEVVAASPMPIVCEINGAAVGGGVLLASLCDYRLISENAFLSLPEIERHNVAAAGMLRRLGCPEGFIRELAYTGRRCSADEALHAHLVDKVCNSDDLRGQVLVTAAAIAERDRADLVKTKAALRRAQSVNLWRRELTNVQEDYS